MPMTRFYAVLGLLLFAAFGTLAAMAISADDPATDAPLPPLEAARTMVVPAGFHVSLFAGEPDVQQPIGFCIDDRGRLWVAEAYNYPHHGTRPGDRILIFEDTDHDRQFDKRTVFYDQLNYVTGIEVGFGGAWVMSPPYFYFIPDRDGDDVPDGKPQVLLDGFGNFANSHNLANGFAWGPDGWLYGTHGRTNYSRIGKPGTPDSERTQYDGGVYRYHPVRHVWEPFADGTTNPWGIDWDDYGEGFVCNCVNPHLFHVIQGAHYEPWRNRASSQFAYERIESIADHLHFVGNWNNVQRGLGSPEEDAAGGGHAHCGTMVYLGDNWPAKYRNTVFMNNIHGHRINNDILARKGSGYTASHGHDLMRAKDMWYVGVTLQYGPDGGVFVLDWSDTGECHSVKNTHRETGRIFKITYGEPPAPQLDLLAMSDLQLVNLQLHANDWYVRHARRLLQEHAAAGAKMSEAHAALRTMFAKQAAVPRKLRALWALKVTGGLTDAFLIEQLHHESEYIRGWAIRLLCEDREPPAAALATFRDLAAKGDSQYVRLQLASALQQLAPADRWPIAEALAGRVEDAHDQNLPLMDWYGIEPLVHDDQSRFVALAGTAKIPLVRRHIARRVASMAEEKAGLDSLVKLLAGAVDAARLDILGGILEGLAGRRTVAMPASWTTTYAALQKSSDDAVQQRSLELALVFDDPIALASLRRQAVDKTNAAKIRNRAVESLVARHAADLAPVLLALITDPATSGAALRGLADYDEPNIATAILAAYPTLDPASRQDALQTLAARPESALRLLAAMESGKIPRTDMTAYTARQLGSLRSDRVQARLAAVWGEVRTTPAEKVKQIAKLQKQLDPAELAGADLSAGRAVFQKNCANCHKLFDAGGTAGPNLTGSQRFNVTYVLENLVDPSAAVSKDFQMELIQTASGRIVTGLVVAENKNAVTVQTVNEKLVIPASEIEQRALSKSSLMPDGMLDKLTRDQLRDLVAYLASPAQVPLAELPAGKE
jgi:putative membrane-bound dehydrogenase-like protein